MKGWKRHLDAESMGQLKHDVDASARWSTTMRIGMEVK